MDNLAVAKADDEAEELADEAGEEEVVEGEAVDDEAEDEEDEDDEECDEGTSEDESFMVNLLDTPLAFR